MTPPPLPEGYVEHRRRNLSLISLRSGLETLLAAGYADPATWNGLLAGPGISTGRGEARQGRLPDGTAAVFKKMKRGGWTAGLWRDRFPGERRLRWNLAAPVLAAKRGVATAAPLAMLIVHGPPGFARGWLATAAIAGAEDLRSRLAREPAPGREELKPLLRQVRVMHDAGVEHRDLNLGNLLVRADPAGGWTAFAIDLDRARLHDGPLPFGPRRSALRRIERSYVKCFGDAGPLKGDRFGLWCDLYSGGEPELARRLGAGRRTGRALLALHRLGWRRRPPA